MNLGSVGFKSALIYTGVSILVSGTFFLVTLVRDYNWLARIGGALWIFILSMIILMPVVTQMVKRKLQS